jgi:hypothetical protein
MVIHVPHPYFNIIAAFTRILRNIRKKKKLVNVPIELREPNFFETYSSLWEAVKGLHMFATACKTACKTAWQASANKLGLSTVVDIVFLELIEIMRKKKKKNHLLLVDRYSNACFRRRTKVNAIVDVF